LCQTPDRPDYPGRSGPPSHHVEGFVDGDLGAALDHRTSPGQLGRRLERRRLEDAVARRALADGTLGDAAVGLDLVYLSGEWIARVDDRRTQLREPRRPLLH